MNNGSRYRRNRRKKRIKTALIISICAILVLFVIFMITGLVLSEKTKDPDGSEDNTQTNEPSQDQKLDAPVVNAYPLALLEDGSTFNSRLSAIPDEADSVCVSLNLPNGELLFRSSVSSHFSNLLVKGDATQISRYTTPIKSDELYSTALLYMADFSNGNSDFVSDVYSSIWSAIACEAISNGINDVLLIPNESYTNVDKLCTLAKSIHLTDENAIIGLAISEDILNDKNSTQLINRLADSFNYLAINATDITKNDEKTPVEQIESSIKGLQLQIMYHNMRVLLPKGTNIEEQTSFIELVTKYNITNWQISPN